VNKNLLQQTSKANLELDETYCGGSKHNPSLIYIVVRTSMSSRENCTGPTTTTYTHKKLLLD
jgi:hypothetical protein